MGKIYNNRYVIYDDYAEIIIEDRDHTIKGSTIIDIEDVNRCRNYNWRINKNGYIETTNHIILHRYIMNYNGSLQIDHINRNKTDNRKSNLRIVSIFINNQNNGAEGISFDKHAQKWKAEIHRFGKYFYAGIYDTKEQAINARNLLINEIDKQQDILLEDFKNKDLNHETGVRPSPHGKWVAKFCADAKVYHVGTFNTKEEAVEARTAAILKHKSKASV